MEKILGLDLGTNSIGWAIRLIDPYLENQIIDKGVLTFEKGVGEGKSGEFPRVQKRTESRSKRRSYQAEKYRKYALLELLINHGMCPLSLEELNRWRHYTKGLGRRYPQSETFIQWLRFDFDGDSKPDFERFGFSKHENHYLFRVLAVSIQERHLELFRNNPMLLGRVLYHLVQRRGFRGRDEEEAKTIMQGSKESNTTGAQAILPFLERYKTLGAALYYMQKEQGGRIRKRYNLRSDYEHELKEISRVQGIEPALYDKLWKAIIWQRPLRSQKGLVGYCTLEAPQKDEEGKHYLSAGKKRCPLSHPLYEEYRTWVFINNLKITFPQDCNRRQLIEEHIYPLFYYASRDFSLNRIGKAVRKLGGTLDSGFARGADIEKQEEKEKQMKVISASLLYRFRELLGEDWKERYGWREIMENKPKTCAYSIDDIWHVLATFDSREKLKEFALEKLYLSEEKAEDFSRIKLPQGYASLSLSAIKKLLPYLRQGFLYSEAVFLANMYKVLGDSVLTEEKAQMIGDAIRMLMKEDKLERQSAAVVNGLISDQLDNREYRYFKESDQELDAYETSVITERITHTIGAQRLQKMDIADKHAIHHFVSKHYLDFLRKPVTARKNELFMKSGRLHDRIFKYLQDTYQVPDERKKNLWHPSEQDTYHKAPERKDRRLLGEPRPISNGFKNPMALKTLYKLKWLVNYLLETGKIDEDTRIVVEIARELNDANMRKAIERYQRDREKQNEGYRKKIAEMARDCGLNLDPGNKDTLDRYRLWVEQKQECLYTGQPINFCDLFDGSRFDFEHTIPASMSFDNELKNLTIADAHYNREIKRKQIPAQLPNYKEDAAGYSAIEPRLKFMEDKVEDLKRSVEEWRHKTSFASTKEIKDACIQHRYLLQFELDYWRKKLDTFTCREYKPGWRNSQLKDTQIVTKYALPYLKTVFKKVEVQKGSVTAMFRDIFQAGPHPEEKSRDKHSHHAIDAAVLTLIPPAAVRDRLILVYNEAKDNKVSFHAKPESWKNFSYSFLLAMEEEVLINFQPTNRALVLARKNIRKRGKQQFVTIKDGNGKLHYKLDGSGRRIPLVAQGDSIRGQLHKESLFGAIRQGEETLLVERYPIALFTSITDCRHIVDKTIRETVETTLYSRMQEGDGMSFDKAKIDPVPLPNGKGFIRKVRCRVAAGRGYLKPQTALEVHRHAYPSKHEYKRYTYAQNDSNALCLYYEGAVGEKTERAFKLVGLCDLASLKLRHIRDIRQEQYYATAEAGRGRNKVEIPLHSIIETGCKVIFYTQDIEELKVLPHRELLKRVYVVYKFNEIGSPYIYLQLHLEARPNDQLGDGDTFFEVAKWQPRLKLKADKFTCAIEGNHFEVMPDGVIKWLF